MDISADKAPTTVSAPRVGDHLALDFLNSIAAPHGQLLEWIGDGPAFLLWLEGAGQLPSNERKEALETFSGRRLDDLALEARGLREWFRTLLAQVKKSGTRVVSQKDIDKLNKSLAAATHSHHLQRDEDRRLRLVWKQESSEPRAFLAPLAQAMAELLCEEDLELVSHCEGAGCSIWFYDRTKSHHRRWCSQAICGNRARVNAFRQRLRGGS
jgi:predicted RNA-binding Zn ribbon-like protein